MLKRLARSPEVWLGMTVLGLIAVGFWTVALMVPSPLASVSIPPPEDTAIILDMGTFSEITPKMKIAAWREAKRLGLEKANGWGLHINVQLVPSQHSIINPMTGERGRLYGEHGFQWTLKKNGKWVVTETVMIYLLPEEVASYGLEVLTHEFLHGIWARRAMTESGFAETNPNQEEWVRKRMEGFSLGGRMPPEPFRSP